MDNMTLMVLRKQNGLTQIQAAKIIGVGRETYGAYESGERKISVEQFERLLKFLNISISLGDTNPYEVNDDLYSNEDMDEKYLSQLSKKERDFIVKLRMMNKEQQKNLDAIMDEELNKK